MRQRRVGSFTLGLSLVVFGILFLVHIFEGCLDYLLIFHLWPIILILLGGEILYFNCLAPEGSYRYDVAAVGILLLLVCFAMCMAGMDWILTNAPKDGWFCI